MAGGALWKQVVVMLTGLPEQALHRLGVVHFIDPLAGRQIAEVTF